MKSNIKPNFNSVNSKSIVSNINLPKISFAKKQTTIKSSLEFKGIGLHSGRKVKMFVHPADEDTGIIFKIKNKLNSFISIDADYRNVTSTLLCTTISKHGFSVSTTEHILSALYGLNINNAIIEISDREVPVMDGSSQHFVNKILDAGTITQNKFVKAIKIKRKVEVRENDKIIRIAPHNETIITCEIGYDSKYIGNQSLSLLLTPEIYTSQICGARTYGFLKDVNELRENGLALGGSLDNAVVISNNGIMNKDGLRYNDEFVRHKTLDLIGDLALSGYMIVGSIYSYKGGHDLNNKIVKKIFSSDKNWEFIDTISQ